MSDSMPSLLTSLMAWYEFEENYDVGHTIMDSSGRGNHIRTTGNVYDELNTTYLGERSAARVSGKSGYGISTTRVYHPDHEGVAGATTFDDFRLGVGNFTIACWVKIDGKDLGSNVDILRKWDGADQEEYHLYYNGSQNFTFEVYDKFNVGAFVDSDSCGPVIQPDTWYFVVAWFDLHTNDASQPDITILVNDTTASGLYCSTTNLLDEGFSTGAFHIGGTDGLGTQNSDVDRVMLWKRVLTQEERTWLYNNGTGRSYSEVNPAAADCKSIDCCPDPIYGYASAAAGDAGVGTNPGSVSNNAGSTTQSAVDADCTDPALVYSDPPVGSKVAYPIFVNLYSNYANATIRYTTNGVDPTAVSDAFSSAIELTGGLVLKARAYVPGCPDGEVFTFTWDTWNIPDHGMKLTYYCTQPNDKVGQWSDFNANGVDDHFFYLEIYSSTDLDVTRFELYQMDSNGEWTTGQVWATDLTITPPEPWPQSETFDVFPLGIYETGDVQVNNSYQSSWGTLVSGTTRYNLYGDPVVLAVSGEIFKLIMFLDNGDQVFAYDTVDDCEAPPVPPEDPPDIPVCPGVEGITFTPKCGGVVDVTFTLSAGVRDYVVYSSTDGKTYDEAATGSDENEVTEAIGSLTAGTQYWFKVRQDISDITGCTFGWSNVVGPTSPLPEATASISLDVSEIDSGGTVTVTYSSANGDPDAAVPARVVVTPGAIANKDLTVNTSGNYTQVMPSPAADTTYTFTFTVDGVDACDNAVATAQVLVRGGVPDCSGDDVCGSMSNTYKIALMNALAPSNPAAWPCADINATDAYWCSRDQWDYTFWGGQSNCTWTPPAERRIILLDEGTRKAISMDKTTETRIFKSSNAAYGGGCRWVIIISFKGSRDCDTNIVGWTGTKTTGTTPAGVYSMLADGTETGMQAITTITIEEV